MTDSQNTPSEANASEESGRTDDTLETPTPGDTDWKSEARKWEARAKANRGAASEAETLREQLTHVNERVHALEAHNAALERTAIVNEVAAKSGVPAALIHGSTRAEIEANAKALAQWGAHTATPTQTVPVIPQAGYLSTTQPDSDERVQLLRNLLNKE